MTPLRTVGPNSLFNFQCLFNLFISSLYILHSIILFSLDNDVPEMSKQCAMFYNILSQTFIVRCKITMKINISQCNAEQYNNYYVHFFSQETLANAMQKIMAVLGSFTSEAEVKVNQLQISINTSHLFCTLILFS